MTMNDDNDIDYKQLTVKELKLIINGYGIRVEFDEKKEDIIKKIYNYKEALGKYKSESIKNNQQNTFTSTINDLKYKQVEKCEILFWKVWKSKVIFKKITSYLSYGHSDSYRYKDIIHVDWIIKNGYTQLLREKVERNELLVFNTPNNYYHYSPQHKITSTTTITSPFDIVFKFINQDDQLNYQFYKKLFKNYYEINYIGTIDADIITGCTIYNNCIPALNVLIQEYNYKINQSMISNIIQSYSLRTIQYTLSTCPLSSELNFSLLDLSKIKIDKKIFKILNWISSFYETNENIKIQWSNGIELLFKYDPLYDNFTINDLIESCIFISSNLPTSNDESDDSTIIKLSKKEIESIKLNFNHQQLKKPIKYSLHCEVVENKWVIKQLLDSHYSKSNLKSNNLLYYLNFESGIGDNNEKISRISNSFSNDEYNGYIEERNFKYSLKYGNLNYLKSLDVSCLTGGVIRKDIRKTLVNTYKYKQYPMILFKYCKEIQMQKKFIHDFSNYHKNKLSPVQKMHPYLLFYLVIELDDIQLAKFTIETLGKLLKYSAAKRNLHYFIKFNYNIQRYIQSREMMNYLMDNGFIDHFSIGNLISWYTRGRIDLLSNFEKVLLKSNQQEINESIINSTTNIGYKDNGIINGQLIKSFIYIIKNSNIYKTAGKSLGKVMLDVIPILLNEHKHLKDVKFIIENTIDEFHPEKMFTLNSLNSNKLLKWSIKHYYQDDENSLAQQIENLNLSGSNGDSCNRCKTNNFYTFYLTGKIDKFVEILKKNQNQHIPTSTIRLTLEMIAIRGDVEVFDLLLKFYFNGGDQDNNGVGIIKKRKEQLVEFLKTSSRYGRIEIFQHLLFNYPFILLPKDNNNGYFSKSILCDNIAMESLKNDNFHLTSFFKNMLSFK